MPSIANACRASDLHPYHGREKGIAPNTVVGHEFVGVIVAKGAEVSGLEVGDRVASPFTSCCGDCFYCRKGAPCRCDHAQAHLFGWISAGEDKLPDDVSDEGGLLAGDILSTAFFCAERGEVGEGATAVVLGCGPVGLLCVMAAKKLGANTIFAVDSVPERLAVAEELGARPLRLQLPQRAQPFTTSPQQPAAREEQPPPAPASASPPTPQEAGPAGDGSSQEALIAVVMAATEGRGADCVLEAVGANSALRLAYELVRPMGTISSVGVNTNSSFPFSPVDAYNKNVTFRCGRCPARAYMTRLLPLLREPPPGGAAVTETTIADMALPWRRIITHRMPLSKGPEAYDMFARRADGCIKIVLDPWA
ncbi:hypothetical protein VOLCADRAFT_90474 [Volvox carteri f. nagariensis]|uniref:Enoyl reductase (ER) domain-containing protein n=1 Tax=Volvox carteri f. nagariensis TaxID=3068 RepID=D8TUH1_VOLCA|nr:uncharacterized protein VOLCADRAFT_90474 [Volvox carteri f. nagariensis]EFJ48706.1 hypothetical protein VOLCADRAFT_90474 [Volvox carteri f. nagariensis]|eukprot:XP_002950038.1 hypothetical protein VOLCADRAFT_90474 [Volvox carteri f. nagariensis]